MTLEGKCLLASRCKKAGDEAFCSSLCYPYRKLHGESGEGGIWGLAGVPKAYRTVTGASLPFVEENPEAAKAIEACCSNVVANVSEGLGFYLFSVPNSENPKGTGTGKTTAACAVLNEYVAERVVEHVQGVRTIDEIPAMFVNLSKFQNLFNSQFRGTVEMKEEASRRYYQTKERMLAVALLVVDDIGVRDATEAFMNEVYEIIDARVAEELSTIYTSNIPLSEIAGKLDDRIASRIEGSVMKVSFKGEDHRKRGIL